MKRNEIVRSLKELEEKGELEVLNVSRNSMSVYDFQDGKEITYTFKRSKSGLTKHVHISKRIPQKYRPNKEKVLAYLLALPNDMLLTLNELWILWDEDDYTMMTDYHDVDSAWVESLYAENLFGRMWFDQNTAIINMQNIVNSALEEEYEDYKLGLPSHLELDICEQTVLTLVHEVRHVMMDTNIILPEDEYPIHLAGENAVEDFARAWVFDHGWNIF
jgi:hypothetical protein